MQNTIMKKTNKKNIINDFFGNKKITKLLSRWPDPR